MRQDPVTSVVLLPRAVEPERKFQATAPALDI